MTESSSDVALLDEPSKALNKGRQGKADTVETAKRVAALKSEFAKYNTADEQIRTLKDQIEVLTNKLVKAEATLTAPLSPEPGSPKTQSDDEYIVVEPGSPNAPENKVKETEAEIRKATTHAKKLEEMSNTAEERTITLGTQVHVLEAGMLEKFDDVNALLEKVKELEELLTAGQVQIAALEEKSKMCDEAQKKVEYEKVLFLETEDQLVKNFKKAHDEAELYRNMIFQLEKSVKSAEEKAAHAEKFMEFSSQRNQELESDIADLNFQIKRISRERSSYVSSKVKFDTELLELHKAMAMFQDKADSLEQELQIYRSREKKVVDDDARSDDEKNVVHEATSTHLVSSLQKVSMDESMDGHASSSETELDIAHAKSNGLDDEMTSLEENVDSHVTHSKLLMSELEKLKSAHILYACEAETSKTQLKDHVKDLEEKVSQLEQEIMISREREERMKQETKSMEAKALEESSLFEGLKMSYADYTCDLERRNSKLEEELILLREKVAANVIEQQKWTVGSDRMKDAENRSVSLEALVADLQTKLESPRECETCLTLKTQIQDLEANLGELSFEIEVSRGRERDVQKEVKVMEEKSASHEQLASEWMEKAASQVIDHNDRVQALEAQMTELREENMRVQTSVSETRSWAEKAASLLREHAEALHGLREGCPDQPTTGKSFDKEENEVLKAKLDRMHLEFRDLRPCDGPEALQMCKDLLFLEMGCLNFQILDTVHKNTNLESEIELLKSQIQDFQNPPELPPQEVKKSFREATLDGEVQSLRAQLVELQSFKTRVSEISSLQAQVAQLQLSLRAAETREFEQNLELVKVNRKVSAAEEEVCSLKSSLLNQVPEISAVIMSRSNELKEQVDLLEQSLVKLEANNASLKEEIDVLLKPNIGHEKVTDEIFLEQAPEPAQQFDVIPPPLTKSKARKRRNRKSGKASILQERIQTANSSSRHRIAVFLFSVFVVAIGMRLSLK